MMAAASGLDATLLELARSMPVPSIPEKLRCATCDKLAINAMRLPCCDNTICFDCSQTLPAGECPICTHSPFDAALCVPAKSLQNTIKAFLKTEAKKRSLDTSSQNKKSSNITSVPSPAPQQIKEEAVNIKDEVPEANQIVIQAPETGRSMQGRSNTQDNHGTSGSSVEQTREDEEDEDEDNVVITTERVENIELDSNDQEHQEQTDRETESVQPNDTYTNQQQAVDFDQTMNGFPNGNFAGMNGFNPMMSMQAFGMGMPNMMGMAGMGMDPSVMFNGGFGNGSGGMGDMGMMGMGMGGGMAGMGSMGGFNGMGGPGFFPHQGNYMQSNFGNAPRQHFFNERGYDRPYGRGFGRGGRGMQYGRGRGGWGYQHQHNTHQQVQYQPDASAQDQASARRGSPSYDSMQSLGPDGDHRSQPQEGEPNDREAQSHKGENAAENTADAVSEDPATAGQHQAHVLDAAENDLSGLQHQGEHNQAADGQVNAEDLAAMQGASYEGFDDGAQYQQQYGFTAPLRGRGGFRGRGSHVYGGYGRAQDSTDLTPAPAPPANAPTGPKAMRQGLPNTGWSGRISSAPAKPAPATPVVAAPYQQDTVPNPPEDEIRDRHPRSRSRSHSRRRNSRHRDRSADDDYESDDAYERRKEKERLKRKDRERRYEDEDDRASTRGTDDRKHRSRSETPTDDSSRYRRRDRESEHHSSRPRRDRSRSRRRRRRRSRSPKKNIEAAVEGNSRHNRDRDEARGDTDRVRAKDKDRKHARRNDDGYDDEDGYDKKDRSHRSSRNRRADGRDQNRERDAERERPRAIIEPPSDDVGFKIKGSRSARAAKESGSSMAPPPSSSARDRGSTNNNSTNNGNRRSSVQQDSSASADPYAEERARAQQGREAREAQRRQTSSSSLLGKRADREDEELDAPRGPKSDHAAGRGHKSRKERRINYRYEDDISTDDRRDAGRWR